MTLASLERAFRARPLTRSLVARSEVGLADGNRSPGARIGGRRAAAQEEAASISSMFLVTTSMVRPSSSVGLNSTTSVPT
jgi:hypothetical protein